MKPNSFIVAVVAIMMLGLVFNVQAQKKAKLGKVCGDPTLPCKSRDDFQSYELPFDTGKNYVIAESQPFYSIILKSVKLAPGADCEKTFGEEERIATQELFPNNKVFALRCNEPAMNYYTNVADDVAFIAVYAGKTLVEANKFLTIVQATKKYPGVRVRKMQTGINGT